MRILIVILLCSLLQLDSLLINGSKFMMVGNIGAFIFVRDKIEYQQAFLTSHGQLEIYKNKYSEQNDVTDYREKQVFICGLHNMVEDVKTLCEQLGFAYMRFEKWD